MKNQRGFLPIVVILLVLLGVFVAIFSKYYRSKSVVESVQISDEQSLIYPEYRHYENDDANFSLEYPKFLTRFEYDYSKYGKLNKKSKKILFCENGVNSNTENETVRCNKGGSFGIWYNGDGWGGGCDLEHRNQINILGKLLSYCLYPDGFGQLYLYSSEDKTDRDEFLLTGTFSKMFIKAEMEKTLSTFKFSDKKICNYNSQNYAIGENFPSTDGCNSCVCEESQVSCTEIACQ